jgi:uncharacterized cupin superfamily protein
LEDALSKSIVITSAGTGGIKPSPVTPDWVINGMPETRSKELARSRDRTSYAMVWDCTAGRFNWHYNRDETLVVLSGEAFVTDEKGQEHRIGAGDVVFFPAGTSSKWHVPEYIRKVAFLRHTMPRPMGLAVLAWNLFLRLVQRGSGSPLLLTLLFDPIAL